MSLACLLKTTLLDQKGFLTKIYQLLTSLEQVEDVANIHWERDTRIYNGRGMEKGYCFLELNYWVMW